MLNQLSSKWIANQAGYLEDAEEDTVEESFICIRSTNWNVACLTDPQRSSPSASEARGKKKDEFDEAVAKDPAAYVLAICHSLHLDDRK